LNIDDELEDKFNNIFKDYLNTKEDTQIDPKQNRPNAKPSRTYMNLYGDTQDDLELYSREIVEEDASKNKKGNNTNSRNYETEFLGQFQRSSKKFIIESPYSDITIPKDYKPKCQFLKPDVDTVEPIRRKPAKNHLERARLLGEAQKTENSEKGFDTTLDYFTKTAPMVNGLSEKVLEALKHAKEFVPSSTEF